MYEGCRLLSGLSVSAEAHLLDSDCSDSHLIVDLKPSRNPLDPAVPICLSSGGSCPFSSVANPLSGILKVSTCDIVTTQCMTARIVVRQDVSWQYYLIF